MLDEHEELERFNMYSSVLVKKIPIPGLCGPTIGARHRCVAPSCGRFSSPNVIIAQGDHIDFAYVDAADLIGPSKYALASRE